MIYNISFFVLFGIAINAVINAIGIDKSTLTFIIDAVTVIGLILFIAASKSDIVIPFSSMRAFSNNALVSGSASTSRFR